MGHLLDILIWNIKYVLIIRKSFKITITIRKYLTINFVIHTETYISYFNYLNLFIFIFIYIMYLIKNKYKGVFENNNNTVKLWYQEYWLL